MQPKPKQVATLLQGCIDNKTHKAGKLIHAHIIRTCLFQSDTFLSNRLIELYSKCNNPTSAHNTFSMITNKDVFSHNAMLSLYCKAGNLDSAREVFGKMPERNVVSWNNMISGLVKCGSDEEGLRVYRLMVGEGLVPSRFTLASVLSACGGTGDVEFGKRVHGVVVKIGLDGNLYVGNALLSMYAKSGCVEESWGVFGEMGEKSEVSFTAMMGVLALTDRVYEALEMFRLMHTEGVRIDSVCLSSVLGVCARGGCVEYDVNGGGGRVLENWHGKQVHSIAIKLGLEGNLHLSNSLLDMYTKNGDMDSAEMVFSSLHEVSVVSWNVMIAGYGQKYQVKKAIEYLRTMQSCGFEPDEVTYINMLAACVKSGDFETARQMFNSLSYPRLTSWNAMLSGYSQSGNHREAVKLFREMQFRSIQPDRTTIAIVLSSCAELSLLEAGKQVHVISQKADLHTDVYVASGLIGMYSKCGKTEMAEHIFNRLPELDIVCWNSMIAGLSLSSKDKEAFTTFKQMRRGGMLPTQFSYATVLSCCAKLSFSFQGRQLHALIAKDGFINDVYVGSSLVGMYCKCGDVDGARSCFDLMPGKNTITWNEMIHGYAQNGCGDEAVKLYKDMIDLGGKPDEVTFIAVLTACSHSGLVDEGIQIFNSIHQNYGLEPELDHYTCLIDSLGRAGRLIEAEEIIDKMPYKSDPVIWEVLLSSCRVHNNVELAKRAADELFRLDPQNSTPYVLLANMYASLGRWDNARAIRELMVDKQVTKGPGYSWIDDKIEAHASVWGDSCSMAYDEAEAVDN